MLMLATEAQRLWDAIAVVALQEGQHSTRIVLASQLNEELRHLQASSGVRSCTGCQAGNVSLIDQWLQICCRVRCQ